MRHSGVCCLTSPTSGRESFCFLSLFVAAAAFETFAATFAAAFAVAFAAAFADVFDALPLLWQLLLPPLLLLLFFCFVLFCALVLRCSLVFFLYIFMFENIGFHFFDQFSCF